MRRLFYAGVLAVVASLSLAVAGPASAATEFGDNCTADEELEAITFFESSVPGNPLPIAAPSAGVVTQWKVNVVPVPITFEQTMKILRLNTGAHTAEVIAEDSRILGGGQNVFDTRISVQAGDRVSLFGQGPTVESLTCKTPGQENVIGGFPGNGGGVGSANPYIELPSEFRIPVSAVIEPDADGDGYGDETQDKCPQSAAVQGECPVIVLDSYPAPKRNAVVVLVGTSTETPVSVSARAKLPRTKKGKKKAKASAARLKNVTRTVTPGKLGRFVLRYPGNLKRALRSLPKGRKLNLKITATATNVAGQVSTDKATLKLRGQLKKAKRTRKQKG